MNKILLAAALLLAGPAFAQTVGGTGGATTIPPTASNPQGANVTGAIDAPKTTTSGNEKATTDAAGVPKGTVGASAGASSDPNATAATKRKHHHRAKTPPQN